MRELHVLDLCSGLGGFSQAFVDAGDVVVRIDNDPRFRGVPHTYIEDIHRFEKWPYSFTERWDVILASPPCTEFSTGNLKRQPEKGLDLVRVCHSIFEKFPESKWSLENARGSVMYISRELGPPTLRANPWYVWGTAPMSLALPKKGRRLRQPYWKFHKDGRPYLHRWDQAGGPETARIPIELSRAVRELVTVEGSPSPNP
jgi:C-5 cytosine-specific DNA methylase